MNGICELLLKLVTLKFLQSGDMEMASRILTNIIIIAYMYLNSGCSINGFGLPGSVVEQHTYTDFSHVIYTQATGIHLNTRSAFEFYIGDMEREMIYPIVSNEALFCSRKFIDNDHAKESTTLKYSEVPIKISVLSRGARLSLSPRYLALSIGYLNRKVLSVEADSSFSMFYSNGDHQVLRVCAVIEPKNQGEHHD
jgi:hypothetical protein|tara:strand:- start:3358 stop:3945 length:588 start_codon:yes stop_codon:yes gene_type:complete